MTALYVSFAIAVISLIYAGFNIYRVLKHDPGTPKMQEIANAIREGSMAYMHRQFKTVAIFAILIFFLLGFGLDFHIAATFIAGAVFSAVAGYIGMNVSVRANVRTAAAAKVGISEALTVAFRGGAITGLFVVGLSLLGVSGFYILFSLLCVDE